MSFKFTLETYILFEVFVLFRPHRTCITLTVCSVPLLICLCLLSPVKDCICITSSVVLADWLRAYLLSLLTLIINNNWLIINCTINWIMLPVTFCLPFLSGSWVWNFLKSLTLNCMTVFSHMRVEAQLPFAVVKVVVFLRLLVDSTWYSFLG